MTDEQPSDEQVDAEEASPKPRKDRVLHTRVPEVLDQELRRMAESLRVPVSNLVRSILQDALQAVDMVGERAEDELRGVAERLERGRARMREGAERAALPADPPQPPLAGIIGFQPFFVARGTHCAVCGAALAVGSEAFLGVSDAPTPRRVVVGPKCLPFDAASRGS